MKKYLIVALTLGVLACSFHLSAVSAPDQELTVSGDGACAKCLLKESTAVTHQVTITVTEEGKRFTYYVMDNEISKKFGEPVCSEHKKIKATGSVKSLEGKLLLTPSKIELVKEK